MSGQQTHGLQMQAALAEETLAQRMLMAGEQGAAEHFRAAAGHYRTSWGLASPTSYGRLVGMMKAAILAGAADDHAGFALSQLAAVEQQTPTSSYAQALALLVQGQDEQAAGCAQVMCAELGAFERTGRAIKALAKRNANAYAEALLEIVADFQARESHLTGVPIADTALMLELLAAARGMAVRPRSELLPALTVGAGER